MNSSGKPSSDPPSVQMETAESETDALIRDAAAGILVQGRPLKELPGDLFIPPEALEVFLESFQGPLDLLLYLIRRQNLDILDIPVALITRQYMEYVELMRQFRLDLASEYLVMAATLAEIKSRMLLPRPVHEDDGEEEDPRVALIRRLQEYERFSQVARELDDRPRVERDLFLVMAEFDDPTPRRVEPRASLNDLVTAFRNVLERSQHNQEYGVGREVLTVRERMSQILIRLHNDQYLRFDDLFDPEEGRAGIVVSFMAILELCRDQVLVLVQNEPFNPIHLKRVETRTD